MIQGFETREVTDIPVRAFVESAGGQMHKKVSTVDQYEKTEWPTFDNQEKPCAVFGILRGTGDILEWCKQVKLDWYYFDHAYFGGNRHGKGLVDDKVYRITKNNYHIQDILSREKINYKRIEKYKEHIKIKPWKYDGDYILVCPPSEHQLKYRNIPNWTDDVCKQIKKKTKKEIKIRDKSSKISLEKDLEKAYACVSYQSVVCIDSILNGVPSFCSDISMGVPVSETSLDLINEPFYPPTREQWIDSLLHSQFTLKEIKDGVAWKTVK